MLRFKIKRLKKKRSKGYYYVILGYDELDLPRIFGRFRNLTQAKRKLKEYIHRFNRR